MSSPLTSEYMLTQDLGAIIVERYEGGTDEHGCKNEISGEGRYTWSDGSSYEGGVRKGLRHGLGKFSSRDGSLVYDGAWQNSKRHGHGTQRYGVGSKQLSSYEGNWHENYRHGKGTMKYASGNIFIGDWVQDRKEGKGTMTWVDRRERFTGEWRADRQSGFGEHVWLEERPPPSSTMNTQKQMCNVYRGQWLDGMRHGQGSFMYADGSRHVGEWFENKKHGPAVFISSSGRTFEGSFENDFMIGKMNQDHEHPELSSAVKLKLQDIARSSEEAGVAADVRDVERSALQVNSDLKVVYKHYAKPDSAAPRDSTVFTMSLQQFITFAMDCRALAPHTPVTVGEVHRMFSRMKRQHFREVAASLSRLTQDNLEKSEEVLTRSWDRACFAAWFDGRQAEDEGYDSGTSITFREFVEGVVRLANIIDVLAGPCGARPSSETSAVIATTAAHMSRGNTAASSAPAKSRLGTPHTEGGGSVWSAKGCGPGSKIRCATNEVSLNDLFKHFVSKHLLQLLVKLAETTSSTRGGADGSRGGSRGGNRVSRGVGKAVTIHPVRSHANEGGGNLQEAGASPVERLKRADVQVNCLYRMYSGPVHATMSLRTLLRLFRDADLNGRAGVTSDDVKKIFRRANAVPDDSCGGDARSYKNEGDPHGMSSEAADLDALSLMGPDSRVDLDFLDEELMPDQFRTALTGLFELLRVRTAECGDTSTSVEPTSAKASDANARGEDERTAIEESTADVVSAGFSDSTEGEVPSRQARPDDPVDAQELPQADPPSPAIQNAQEGEFDVAVASAANATVVNNEITRDESGKSQCPPEWVADAKVFVTCVLQWAAQRRTQRDERMRPRCASRAFPQSSMYGVGQES